MPGVSGFQLHFGDAHIFTPGDEYDVLVALNAAALKTNLKLLKPNGIIIANISGFDSKNLRLANIPEEENPLENDSLHNFQVHKIDITKLTKIAVADYNLGNKESERCKNMFVLGLVYWLYHRSLDKTTQFIEQHFKKDPTIASANIAALKAGYNFGETTETFTYQYEIEKAETKAGFYRSINGNQAMAMGFLAAGFPLVLSFSASCVVSVFVLGWLFKRGIVDPLFKYGMMPIVVATIGLSIAMRNAVRAGYSAEPQPFPNLFPDEVYNIAGVTISATDIGTFVFAIALVLITQAFLAKTVTGRAMQAVAQNTESASVLGINVPRMIFYTFAINAVLAAAAAILVTPTYLAKFDMGSSLGNKAFFAAIIGGFNNSRGALLGGVIVGVCENLAAAYISPAYKDAVALIIFMVVILFKPQGLLGKKVERKV